MDETLFGEGEMERLFELPAALPLPPPPSENPCVDLYGAGPAGRICRDCIHLLRLRYHNKTYLKCNQRTITHGAGTDHRARYPACAKFEERKEE